MKLCARSFGHGLQMAFLSQPGEEGSGQGGGALQSAALRQGKGAEARREQGRRMYLTAHILKD